MEKRSFNEIDKGGERVITNEKNVELYELLLEKFTSGIFSNRKCSIEDIINKGGELFSKLTIEQQCKVLLQIIIWSNTAQQSVDLSSIGGSLHSGMLRVAKKISNLAEVILIEQSAAGLYERRIDLLTV